MSKWSKDKPTKPGVYDTRYTLCGGQRFLTGKRFSEPHRVEVKRLGRRLHVFPQGYPPAPMSDIGDKELQWRGAE